MTPHRFLACLLLAGLSGCAASPEAIVRTITPETVSLSVTDPNLFNGPAAATKGGNGSRRDSLGVIGGMVSLTYRIKPIRIEREEVQPVRVVPPAASPSPRRAL